MRPWIVQFNALMDRLQAAIEQLDAFNADVAHEMRTPLAGLRAHAQLARKTNSPEDLNEALGAVMLGAVLLTVNGVVVVGLVLPAGSVVVVASVCGPLLNGVVVQLQLPLVSATAVQSTGPPTPSRTVTVLPGSAVPVTVGVLSLVVLLSVGLVTAGAAGAVVSIVKLRGALAGPVLPALSVWVAVMACAPLLSGVLGVQLQLPPASAVAVQSVVEPSFTVTVAFGSAVPTIAGVVVLLINAQRWVG
ncbi:MAG: hypothetical protein HC853_16630 [Anaerolineae bacterium]|nr:hypothetical protein [Anaerolineae bacterium]